MPGPFDYTVQPVNALGAYLSGVQAKQGQVEGENRNALLKMQQQTEQQKQQQGASEAEQKKQRAMIDDLAQATDWVQQAPTPQEQAQRWNQVIDTYKPVMGDVVEQYRDPSKIGPVSAWAKREQAKWSSPQAVTGPDGKPAFGQVNEAGQSRIIPGMTPPPKASGLSVTMPDGTVIQQGGDAAAPTKAIETNLQQAVIDGRANLDRLNTIMGQYKPEYSTYGAQIQAWGTNQAQKFGVNVPPEQVAAAEGYSAWKADTLDNVNRAIKEMTGASMGVQEAERIIGSLPSIDDGPAQFQSKMKSVQRRINMSVARASYSLKHGLKIADTSLDKMTHIYNKRGDEIAAELSKTGIKGDQLSAAVRQKLDAEFGQ